MVLGLDCMFTSGGERFLGWNPYNQFIKPNLASVDQWKYIWKSDWSAIKILYLFVRYYTLVDMISQWCSSQLVRTYTLLIIYVTVTSGRYM